MRPAFSIKKLFPLLPVLILAALCCGCTGNKPADAYTLGEWIIRLTEQAGIEQYEQKMPYFINVPQDSPYYSCVQAAVEWGVLNRGHAFDPEEKLSREWTAYTLMNLMGYEKDGLNTNVRDLQKTQFREQVQAAVASGLMKTDSRNLFDPAGILSRSEADQYLFTVIRNINDPSLENVSETKFIDDLELHEGSPEMFDRENMTFRTAGQNYQPGDIIALKDDDGMFYLTVTEVHDGYVGVRESEFDELFSEIWMEGKSSLDPQQAQIITDDSVIQEGEFSFLNQNRVTNCSFRPAVKTFQVRGYQVRLSISKTGVKADVTRKLKHGSELFAGLRVNDMKISYRFRRKNSDDDLFMKVSFDSEENFGMRNSIVRHISADLSSLKAADFAAKLNGLFQKSGDREDTSLTLCRIRLPIAGNPLLTALMKLDLHILASGRAECVLTQECEAGFESRNGKVRMIRSFEHDEKAAVHADTRTTADISVSLDLIRKALMDIRINAGIKASCDTVLHLYDNDSSQITGTSVPSDFATEAAENNPDVLVCADMKGNWILDVLVNSSSTAAGMLGLSGRVSLLNEKNNTLIPSLSGHFENGHKVSRCTRHERIILEDPEEIQVSEKIRLSSYALILMKGESKEIVLKGLPEGYGIQDLEFLSSDPAAVSVDEHGILYGNESGSAKITVRTADQMHAAYCSVIVAETAG